MFNIHNTNMKSNQLPFVLRSLLQSFFIVSMIACNNSESSTIVKSDTSTLSPQQLIPKDVVICDWHYERADKTAVYFGMKGFNVITCPWRNPLLASVQLKDMISFRNESTKLMKPRFQGIMQTVWSGAPASSGNFMQIKKICNGVITQLQTVSDNYL